MTSTHTTNASRARAALLALPLLASGAVLGIQVTRASLLGYRVGTEVLEADAAAERLAALADRVRAALAGAVARLHVIGIHGVYSQTSTTTRFGRPMIVVRVRVDSASPFAKDDEWTALVEAALSCRDARLGASIVGGAVHVCG